jgi:integrase
MTRWRLSRNRQLTLRASLILAAVPKPELKPGEEPEEDPLVFGLRPDSITQGFARACERCGIKDLRVHDLRHSSASRWVASGLDIAEVRVLTRHASLDSLGRYLHADVNTVREKMNSLDREK